MPMTCSVSIPLMAPSAWVAGTCTMGILLVALWASCMLRASTRLQGSPLGHTLQAAIVPCTCSLILGSMYHIGAPVLSVALGLPM